MVSRFPVPFGSGRNLFGRSDPFLDLHREMNRLFDDALRGAPAGPGSGALMMAPVMDIHDREDAIEISAELPGVSQQDIDLRIEGDMLTVRGEKRNERKDEQAHLVERSYGSFQRTVQLPFAPNANEVKASFTDGVLTITLPKTAQKEKSQRIEVRSGQGSKGGQQMIEGSFAPTQSSAPNQEQSGSGAGSGSARDGEKDRPREGQGNPDDAADRPQGT